MALTYRKDKGSALTQKELEQQEQNRQNTRAYIIRLAILLFASLTFVLGFIYGAAQ